MLFDALTPSQKFKSVVGVIVAFVKLTLSSILIWSEEVIVAVVPEQFLKVRILVDEIILEFKFEAVALL